MSKPDMLFFFHVLGLRFFHVPVYMHLRCLRFVDSLPERNKFHYDTVWGGLFLRGEDAEAHFYTDYGFPFYNDHHFHLGYFLYALAYYVRHDAAWAQRMYLVKSHLKTPACV